MNSPNIYFTATSQDFQAAAFKVSVMIGATGWQSVCLTSARAFSENTAGYVWYFYYLKVEWKNDQRVWSWAAHSEREVS